jgi:hypothetical protein
LDSTSIWTKINCITLKIHSKADFKSKSQNNWQQIILFSRRVIQMICAWPKIWTLSGRLSLMRNVQLMKKIYIYCVHVYRPHHCCGDWLTFGCFVPMIADHNIVKKSFGPLILTKINCITLKICSNADL